MGIKIQIHFEISISPIVIDDDSVQVKNIRIT